MSVSPVYKKLPIIFNKGQVSRIDSSLIPIGACNELTNFVLDKVGRPTKVEGIQKYNSTVIGTSKPIRGSISFVGEDGSEYLIVACNNALYWDNGSGVFTAVKYETENVAVTIDTANYDYEFIIFPKTIAGSLKWMVYVITDDYPISNTANGVANKYCTISRALRLQISSSVIIAKNVYYDSDSTRTAGADDIEVGQGASEAGWPQQGRFPVVAFDRAFVFNYAEAKNNYAFSEAQNSEDWTPVSGSNVGGGKVPDDFVGAILYGSSILGFTRKGILNLQISPSSPTNWRETWLKTTFGCISHRTIVLHSDGWVYFLSEQGICRTDGRVAEKVDYDIEDKIKVLPQLLKKKYSWLQGSTADWNAGTPSNGGVLLDTSGGQLKQLPQTTDADFNAGTKTNVTVASNSVTLSLTTAAMEVNNDAYDAFVQLYQANKVAQSFKVTTNDRFLTRVALFINRAGNPTGNMYVDIMTDSGGKPSMSVIPNGSVQVSTSGLGASPIWVDFTFATPPSLTVNTTYWLVFYYPAGSSSDCVEWKNSMAEVYSAGQSKKSSDNGATWSTYTFLGILISDCTFRLYTNYYNASGDIISQTLDYGATPSALGNLAGETTVPTNTTLLFQTRTSANNIDWTVWTNIGTAGENNGAINSTVQRYIQWKALFTTTDGNATATLSAVYIGGQFISQTKDIGLVPSAWGVFAVDEDQKGQTIIYEINVSADNSVWDGWVTITNNSIPAVTLRRYLKYRIRFNTTDYSQIPYLESFTQYWFTGANVIDPCAFSFGERIGFSVASVGSTVNDHTWIGMTKPLPEIEKSISPYTGEMYPQWTKCDFIKANVFLQYRGILIYGYSSEGYMYYQTGSLNDGSAFTSTLISKAFSVEDVESIWRFLYVYSKSDNNFSLYVRTRRNQGAWGSWSSAKTIELSSLVARSDKVTLAGLVSGDFVQFKLETTVTDDSLEIHGMNLYYDIKPVGL